jgi:hypothetical protein
MSDALASVPTALASTSSAVNGADPRHGSSTNGPPSTMPQGNLQLVDEEQRFK